MEIIAVVIGLAVGVVLAYFILKAQSSGSNEIELIKEEKQQILTELSVIKSQKENLATELKNEKDAHAQEREKNVQLNRQLSTVESDYKNLKIKLDEHKSELAELQQQFKNEFKNLAQEIFEEKSKKFTDQNKTNIGELLNPLREKIDKFEEKVEKSNKENLIWNSALKEQITSLKELNLQ
ncbi:MAG: DNA recombination protein RmuC, partial [Bacteroidetes bacterium]